jgi:hypothetical protein
VLVGGAGVEDDADHHAGRHDALDRIAQANELLMPAPSPAATSVGPERPSI